MVQSSTLLTTAQVAQARGVSVRTVHRMIADGDLKPASKLPGGTGAYLFRPAAVDRAFKKRHGTDQVPA